MFGSPGRPDPDEKHVRDNEYVDEVDMGSATQQTSEDPSQELTLDRKKCDAVEQRRTATWTRQQRRCTSEHGEREEWEGPRPVIVRVSASLTSARESQSVDHVSQNGTRGVTVK